jgi:hypothetical protein
LQIKMCPVRQKLSYGKSVTQGDNFQFAFHFI